MYDEKTQGILGVKPRVFCLDFQVFFSLFLFYFNFFFSSFFMLDFFSVMSFLISFILGLFTFRLELMAEKQIRMLNGRLS
jgi:hypothetical protein